MLNQIKLTNFRKHTNTVLPLQTGLMALRGLNEAGKSTVIEAICYALFGVKALRSPLEDTVTYGEPVNTLKVELDIRVDGVDYSIKRGKSGAEVNYDGGRVTGQTEVTNYLCGLMRIDTHSAPKLMLANQNEIRGALESGPKATTELIERMAEFDQIDHLIDLMQEKLTLGNTAGLQARLEQAAGVLGDLGTPVEPDYGAMQMLIDDLQRQHQQAQQALSDLDGDVAAAQNDLDEARAAEQVYRSAIDQLAKALDAVQRQEQVVEQARAAAALRHTASRSEDELRTEIAQLEQADRLLQVYRRVAAQLEAPEATEDTTPEALTAEIARLRRTIKECEAEANKAYRDIELHKAALTTGSCGFCGQDFSHLPEVAEKNAQHEAAIREAQASYERAHDNREQAEKQLSGLDALHLVSTHRFVSLESYPELLTRVGNSLPPMLLWTGPDYSDMVDAPEALNKAKAELKTLLDAQERERRAQAQLLNAAERLKELEQAHTKAKAHVEQVAKRPDVDKAVAARDAVQQRRRPLQDAVSRTGADHQEAVFALRDAKRQYEASAAQRAAAQHLVEDLQAQIKATEFNNALLKKVRQARPLIADKLWTIVLNAVSAYFSEMRGQRSKVTKDGDGFKVDEHPVQTLSGSTLDILGLAIRVALVRTFLPNAPFMVLDEPCAAMDAARTEATLGFIVACGFQQVLLVTHEDTSETVADHMIEIGS